MSNQSEEKKWIIERNEEYRNGEPTVPDYVYNERYERYCKMYPNDDISKLSIIESVEDDTDKETLPIMMYSLEKEHTIVEVKSWIDKKQIPIDTVFIATAKYDGISLCVDEETDHCNTRGDGVVGKNRTEQYQYIKNKQHFANPEISSIYTYGEAIIPKSDWKENFDGKINPNNNKLYTSPRNTTGGLFNNKNSINPEKLSNVVYMRYGLALKSDEELDKIKQIEILNSLNYIELPYRVIDFTLSDSEIESTLDELYEEWSKQFNIDGLVIEVNDKDIRSKLGREENMNPKWAIAYKNPKWSEVANTQVKNIQINISKQGIFNPIIEIEPVVLSNAKISNVTGYNIRYLVENNIAKNSRIDVIRSGEVIPKHIYTTDFNESDIKELMDRLSVCPSCGNKSKMDENGVNLYCDNPLCPEKLLSELIYFFNTIEIENFGEKEIEKLFKLGYTTPSSILNITYKQLFVLDGWGEKSIEKLFKQFNALKSDGLPLANLMQALNLFDGKLGKKLSQKIFDEYKGNDDFSDSDVLVKLTEIDGVSDITANYFIAAYRTYYNNYIDFPIPIKYIKTPQQKILGNKYEGFAVCMTGFRDAVLENKIKQYGGTIASGVSKNTTHLLVKDFDSGSSKIEKAKKLRADGVDIQIMTRDEFLDI